jgi:hypothetical protein
MEKGAIAVAQLKRFLDGQQWEYMEDGEGVLHGLVVGDNGQWHWAAGQRGDGRFLTFHAYGPVNVPARRRAAAAEYLARATWGMCFGNFEMDWTDGQVSFRTCLPIEASGVSEQSLTHLIFASCMTMDRYLRGLLAVSLGKVSPARAVRKAEANRDDGVGNRDGSAPASTSTLRRPSRSKPSGRRSGFSPSDN